jgi:acyl-coenzyme A synthetase/AMP-(fatty) acid ligase/acyl carrier protein
MVGEWLAGKKAAINLDEVDSNLSDQNLGLVTPPHSYAYVRYTSGSTGQAKGAVKTHRQVLHTVMVSTNNLRLCIDDRISHLGRESLGKHVLEALLNGAALYPMDIKEKGMMHLAAWLIHEGITSYQSFPTAFRHFASTLTGQEYFPSLRLIRLEGESLNQRDVALYKKHFSAECLLVNSYSSAETGTVCLYLVDKSFDAASPHVPVGYPVEGTQVVLLDDSGKPVGFSQPGEIVIKSRFLSSGYWQRLETTGEKFRSTPDGGEERIYLTGDLGRKSEDGCLELLGRKDSQVKIRSFRVDIGEVEAVLADHPGIREAVVIADIDRWDNARLVAYLVPRSRASPTISSLRDFLKEKLPDYMIPSMFVALTEFPLTATGKVDRRALPESGNSRPAMDTPCVAPRTPIEQQVEQIWAETLSLDRVGIHDNFFDLGGHSLAATRVVFQVLNRFQLEMPLESLFVAPTVAEMSAVIEAHQGKKVGEANLERMVAELELLSEDEARRLIAEESGKPSRGD